MGGPAASNPGPRIPGQILGREVWGGVGWEGLGAGRGCPQPGQPGRLTCGGMLGRRGYLWGGANSGFMVPMMKIKGLEQIWENVYHGGFKH